MSRIIPFPKHFVSCSCGQTFWARTEDAARWRFFTHLRETAGHHEEVVF